MKDFELFNQYICTTLIEPSIKNGDVILATIDDIEELSKYWYYAHLEINHATPITKKESTEYVEKLFKTAKIYKCIKNDEINSIGYYEIKDSKGLISGIYTVPSKRRCGYATNLVATMTRDLLNQNCTPMLLADKNYKASNALYIKLGYKLK